MQQLIKTADKASSKEAFVEKIWLERLISAVLDDEVNPVSPPGVSEEDFIVKRLGIEIKYLTKEKNRESITDLEAGLSKDRYSEFGKISNDQLRYLQWKKKALDSGEALFYKFGEKNYILPGLKLQGVYNGAEMQYYKIALQRIHEAKTHILSHNFGARTTLDIQSFVIESAVSETLAKTEDRIALSKKKEEERIQELRTRSASAGKIAEAAVSTSLLRSHGEQGPEEKARNKAVLQSRKPSSLIELNLRQARAGDFKPGKMSFVEIRLRSRNICFELNRKMESCAIEGSADSFDLSPYIEFFKIVKFSDIEPLFEDFISGIAEQKASAREKAPAYEKIIDRLIVFCLEMKFSEDRMRSIYSLKSGKN